MLQSLHVKNLALIEEAEVEWKDGLNILTGETGAGKSLLLGSVHLALGGKYSASMLREGADYGLVEMVFYIRDPKQKEKLVALEIEPEDGIVVLSRKLMDGRSISRINGEMVPIGRLKAAAEILIDIHGQHEHQSLLYKKKHLEILDAYAKEEADPVKKKVRDAYRVYREAVKTLEEADKAETERRKEADFLSFEASEIREASLVTGEDEELEQRYKKMLNAKKITDSIQEAYQCTGELSDVSASSLLSRAIHAMSEASAYDEHIKELYGELLEIDSLLNESAKGWRTARMISTGNSPTVRKNSASPKKSFMRPKTGSIRSIISKQNTERPLRTFWHTRKRPKKNSLYWQTMTHIWNSLENRKKKHEKSFRSGRIS